MEEFESMAISKFKATCLAALERVRRTRRPIVVTRRGVPVAQVVPVPPTPGSDGAFGSLREGAEELGDVVEPLSAKDWEALR
jgi:prevent-host-death family protein